MRGQTLQFSTMTSMEQTIVEVIPLVYAESGAETLRNETGTVRLEFVNQEGEQTENE